MPAAVMVSGVGAVTPVGRELSQIAAALRQTAGAAERVGNAEVRRVPEELLADPENSRLMRRAGRYPRMATIAASDALTEAQRVADVCAERIGLIVATGLGPHTRTFKFLDGILDCGDDAALPTDFSHSVHGVAASYIAQLLGIQGPACTVTDFTHAFEQAVQLAQCWLWSNECDRVLVGAVEEVGDVLLHVAGRMAPGVPLGEGAAFFALDRGDTGLLLSAQGTMRLGPAGESREVRARSDHFGRLATGAAVQLLASIASAR